MNDPYDIYRYSLYPWVQDSMNGKRTKIKKEIIARLCTHDFADTGTTKSWCKHCDVDGEWDSSLLKFLPLYRDSSKELEDDEDSIDFTEEVI